MHKRKLLIVNICMLAGCIIIVGTGIYKDNRSAQQSVDSERRIIESREGQTEESVELFTTTWQNKLLMDNEQIYRPVDLDYPNTLHEKDETELLDDVRITQESEIKGKTYSDFEEEAPTQITKNESDRTQTEEIEQSNHSNQGYTASKSEAQAEEREVSLPNQSIVNARGDTETHADKDSRKLNDSNSNDAMENTNEETKKEEKVETDHPSDEKDENKSVDNDNKEDTAKEEAEKEKEVSDKDNETENGENKGNDSNPKPEKEGEHINNSTEKTPVIIE
ncbi:hypothetical protein [Oceanobacillus sp. J11TS1]|uniref:hypothetical protein n=1 Tax=Oceanobacillus sp. J11TS1 TaxID=2807191 RepID=UPI001B2CA1F8|nr:hypothetical protein [Oceanobacillus sp. J11TS1]GIO21698.1 hypothetical protein J11TS1_02790 [Oceanobacillus sp. J11TS1]